MSVSIGTVWDRAVEVLRGRAGILAPIALLTIFLPNVLTSAVAAFADPTSRGSVPLTGIVTLVLLVASVWGQLAMLAVATHPATTRADAGAQATRRLLPTLGIVIVLGIAAGLAFVPLVATLIGAGVPFGRTAAAATLPTLPAGTTAFIALYTLALGVAALWLGARLVLLNPVILNERRGFGSVLRSVRLTRGLTLKVIGVMLLFVVVLAVAASAAQFVIALPLRLILGAESLPTVMFLAGIAGAAVTTVFTAIAAAFTAQLYVATAGEPAAG